jgi:GNAT superfamily N-acetyltransferase
MEERDLAAVADLAEQLGYAQVADPGDAATLPARFARIGAAQQSAALLVADRGGQAVAWMHIHEQLRLEQPAYVEIVALVVHRECRRMGLGAALVERAAEWARARGFDRLRVRSNAVRKEAHDFYPALGFTLKKTQRSYERLLS